MEDLARKSGPILESAVQMLVVTHAPFFTKVGPELRHRLTGQTIEEFVAGRRKSNPNDYADYEPVTEEQVMHETIENACLTPSPASLAKLYKLVGELRYHALLKEWGTDAKRMLPGKRPGYAEKSEEKNDDGEMKGRNNPYSDNFDGTEEQRQARIASLLRTSGSKFVSSLAKSAGKTIANQPLRR
jgi:hypothetical protein